VVCLAERPARRFGVLGFDGPAEGGGGEEDEEPGAMGRAYKTYGVHGVPSARGIGNPKR
jgi:hypothetical protein